MKNPIKTAILFAVIFSAVIIIAGCEGLKKAPVGQAIVHVQVGAADAGAGGRSLGSRFLAAENDRAVLTVSGSQGAITTLDLTANTNSSGGKVFSGDIQLAWGQWKLAIATWDAQGGLLTLGTTDVMVNADEVAVDITLEVANQLAIGKPLSLAANQVAYIRYVSTTDNQLTVQAPGVTFWVCETDGSWSGSGSNNNTVTPVKAGEPVVIRAKAGAAVATVLSGIQHWSKVAVLTDTTTNPAITTASGWEFMVGEGTKVYFATPSGTGEVFMSYDLSTGTKATLLTSSSLAAAGYMSNLAAANGKLYYFANSGDSYDPTLNSWTAVTYPSSRGEPGVGTLGTKLYYFGARDIGSGMGDNFQVYDASNNSWATTGSRPAHASTWAGVVGLGGFVYVIGGSGGTGVNQMADRYDPVTDSWTRLPDLPAACVTWNPGAVAWNNQVWIYTGSTLAYFDPAMGAWSDPILSKAGSGRCFGLANNQLVSVAWDNSVVGANGNGGYVLYRFVP